MSGDISKFKSHLRRQLSFLERSCAAYDSGFSDEAIRIATVIRTLVHNTPNSTSLLKHLNATDIKLFTTVTMKVDEGVCYFWSMGTVKCEGKRIEYIPNLDDFSSSSMTIPVDEWWNQIVHVVNPKARLKRKDIVLTAANKDGGAHVDRRLTAEYDALASDGALGKLSLKVGGVEYSRPITDAHLVAIRTMGNELLKSPELLSLVG